MILTLFGEEFLPDPAANSGKNKGKKKQDKKKDVEAPAAATDAPAPTEGIQQASSSATVDPKTVDTPPAIDSAPQPDEADSIDAVLAASIAEQLFMAAIENMQAELSPDSDTPNEVQELTAVVDAVAADAPSAVDTIPSNHSNSILAQATEAVPEEEEEYVVPIQHAMAAEALLAEEFGSIATQHTTTPPELAPNDVAQDAATVEEVQPPSADEFMPVATHEPQDITEDVASTTAAPGATTQPSTATELPSPEKVKPIKGSRKIPADAMGLPDDWDGNKQYYSIGEVADLFKVNTSHIRFWTNEFKLKVRTNRKGDRLYTPDQIREIKTIHHLVKVRGYTLAGAKAKLKSNGKLEHDAVNLKEALTSLRDKLLTIRNQLY